MKINQLFNVDIAMDEEFLIPSSSGRSEGFLLKLEVSEVFETLNSFHLTQQYEILQPKCKRNFLSCYGRLYLIDS